MPHSWMMRRSPQSWCWNRTVSARCLWLPPWNPSLRKSDPMRDVRPRTPFRIPARRQVPVPHILQASYQSRPAFSLSFLFSSFPSCRKDSDRTPHSRLPGSGRTVADNRRSGRFLRSGRMHCYSVCRSGRFLRSGKFLRSGRFLRSDRMRCHSGKLRLRCMLRCSAMCRSDSFRYYMNRRNRKTGYDYVHCYP